MRTTVVVYAIFCLFAATVSTLAVTPRGDLFLKASMVSLNGQLDDRPLGVVSHSSRADTLCWGGHDGNGYAVLGGIWDFADGTLQGWYGIDQTLNTGDIWWARMTADDYEFPLTAPMTNGSVGHLWCGGEKSRAIAGCWECDAGAEPDVATYGYKIDLCQRMTSEFLVYTGDDIVIDFQYYTDSEGGPFDFTKVQVVAFEGADVLGVLSVDNLDAGIEGVPFAPFAFNDTLYASEIPAGTDGVKLRFEFVSDGAWADDDGDYCSTYGPIGIDDVNLSGGTVANFDFEDDDEGFIAEYCPGQGNFVAVHDVANYNILDPCDCDLRDYVLAFHDENHEHGDPESDQNHRNMAVSPMVNRAAYPAPDYNNVFATWDMYALLPFENGVLYRPGWFYEPWECEFTGAQGWSPRVGQGVWLYVGTDPDCFSSINNGTNYEVPGHADYYRFCVEVYACCSCFGISDCSGESNETPLFDNFQVCLTHVPNAPVISYGDGCYFNDAFSRNMFIEPTAEGRCDSWYAGAGAEPPYVLADSLAITGPPVVGATSSWEAYLWIHLPRVGPIISNIDYSAWKARLPGDPEAGFVAVRMDSCETIMAFSNKFSSYFHESTIGFDPAYDDLTDENEILPDDLFTPGTLIEYFVTANYVGSTENSFVEDTSGGFFRDFDILPSMREDPSSRDIVWPIVLYLDAYNRGAENYIRPALNSVLPEIPGMGPNFDQYDEDGSATNYNGNSIYRVGNNGATLPQLLAYETIIVNSGDFGAGAMEESDMIGLEDWLLTSIMGASEVRQALIMNGDQMAAIIEHHHPAFLHNTLGAELECSPYSVPDCPAGTPEDDSYCVQIIDMEDPSFPTAMDIYGYGNGCPLVHSYSVLSPSGTGFGNRSWFDYDFSGPKGIVDYAQILHENLGLANYRSTIEGYSYHHITSSFDSESGDCLADSAGIVSAIVSEIWGTLDWVINGPPADVPGPDGVETAVNRLHQNRPNPFNPRTVISFSVARKSRVELAIYDVTGRLVRRLLNKTMDAGLQSITWDGMGDAGHKVGSGVYWSQLTIDDYKSTKRMVLLK